MMTALMEEVIKRVASLPEGEQNSVASHFLELLQEDELWRSKFAAGHDVLDALEREALEEHRRGETRPLEESL